MKETNNIYGVENERYYLISYMFCSNGYSLIAGNLNGVFEDGSSTAGAAFGIVFISASIIIAIYFSKNRIVWEEQIYTSSGFLMFVFVVYIVIIALQCLLCYLYIFVSNINSLFFIGYVFLIAIGIYRSIAVFKKRKYLNARGAKSQISL